MNIERPSRFLVTLRAPSGQEMRLEDRLERRSLGTMSESLEEDLAELVHGDISFTISDHDGAVEAFVDTIAADEEWEVRIERELEGGGYETLFGGVLDLPESLSYDRLERTVDVQALSYSKLMDRASAETLRRTVDGRTATGSAGTKILTVSPDTTNLSEGDTIELVGDSASEKAVISTVDSSSQLTLTKNLENAHSGSELALKTPYRRHQSIAVLAADLFDEAGITDHEIDLSGTLANFPIATPASRQGIPVSTNLTMSLANDLEGNLSWVLATHGTYETDGPTGTWANVSATVTGEADWTPYYSGGAKPATVYRYPSGFSDSGAFGQCFQYDSGDRFNTLRVTTGGPPPTDSTLYLYKNGAEVEILDQGGGVPIAWTTYADADRINNQVWVSWRRGDDSTGKLQIYDVAGDTLTDYYATPVDGLRYCKALDRMLVLKGGKIEFHTTGAGKSKDFELDAPAGVVRLWTFRVWADRWMAVLHAVSGVLYLRIWEIGTREVIADYELVGLNNARRFATVWTDSGGAEYLIVATEHQSSIGAVLVRDLFVIADHYAGVVPYADFEGMSCVLAMGELAVIAAAVFRVDQHRVGLFRTRVFAPNEILADLETPLKLVARPLWEWYRTSAKVEGNTEAGEDIERYVGATGESSRQIEISSKLITTIPVADTVGLSYVSVLSIARRQIEGTWRELGIIPRPRDLVTYDGVSYLVLDAKVRFDARTVDLKLASL